MKPTQSKRPLAITTSLGPDALLLTRFSLRERISAPFEIEADLAAVDANADFNKVVGHNATIRLELGKKGTRFFNGYVSRLVQTGNQGQYARYRATIVPWLWFLTRTSDCRVFQRQSALDIAEEVFNGHRFGSDFFDLQTSVRYPKRRYCVQYRETDFNFVNRLFESEGIYYWFSHTNGQHRLVLADRIGASKPAKGYEKIEYHEAVQGPETGREIVTQWTVEKEVQTVKYQLKDYDFKKPSDPLKGKHEISREHGMARFALYDYPGEYFEAGDADRYAQVRLEELQARHEQVHGITTAMGLAAGGVFELQKHPQSAQNRKYLITDLQLTAEAGEFASGGGGEQFFSCNFTAIPSTTPFRPARITPKPVIQGIQTATVVGPSGQEIYVDKHARVKVQFHWDRYGKKDENSSCWVRVAQPWAGKGFGSMNIPRIGQEVVVEFLEGDPDRPLINGRVYNDENMPHSSNAGRDGKPGNSKPSGIPAAAMMTSFKSNSLGGSGGHNEITMNDTGGSEGLFFKAQKDEIHNVGNDREDTVGHDEKRKVANDRTRNVGNDEKITIANNRTEDVGGNETLSVAKNRTRTVAKNETVSVALMRTHSVGVNEMINVGAAQEITVGGAQAISVGLMQANTVGLNRTSNVAKDDSLSVGKKLSIEAGDEITIKTGDASISMKKDGTIIIKGKDITIKGSGDVVLKGKKVAAN